LERLKQRLATAKRALTSLDAVLREPKTEIVRDAAIQRFEYTFEACWKAAQFFLKHQEGTDAGSPKSAIRACFQMKILNEEEARLGIAMVDDRNLTVHTYNEDLAEQIFSRLAGYCTLMNDWLAAMEKQLLS